MAKHLVFVGGGHAHLTALGNLRDYIGRGHRVTVVSPVIRHYYSGMGPGMLSGIYAPHEIRFNVKKLVEERGALFVEDRAIRVDPESQTLFLESGQELSYDLISFNTGSFVPLDLIKGPMENVFPVKPIVNLLKARRAILDSIVDGVPNLVVLGGGPAGLELAGNIWRLVEDSRGKAHVTLVTGRRLLPGSADVAREIALASLKRRGIEVLEGVRVDYVEDGNVVLNNGKALAYDMVFPAVGVRSYSIFQDSGLPIAEDGALLVNRHLHSVAYPNIFGGGDCVNLEGRKLDRVGVYAVRQNPILYGTTMATLEGGRLETFSPQPTYMLIFNLGDGTGIFVRKSWVWSGRLAFLLKDYIDRRFMKKFQISGELQDTTEYPDG